MTVTKLRIDIPHGLVEVEGEELFVRDVYKDFKDRLAKTVSAPAPHVKLKAPTGGTPASKPPKSKGKGSRNDYNGKLDKTLDLSAADGKPSLKDFMRGIEARSLTKKNAAFVHYLKEHAGVAKVNVDHIYTCHNEVGKLPGALRQSLRDASGEGLIEFGDPDDIALAIPGINWLKDQTAPKGKA
jgi:hypothetical protein